MKQVKDYPPFIEQIRNRFGALPKGVVFTYGDILYNPQGYLIDRPLEVHEQTHTRQQGSDPDLWWSKYLTNDNFRASQELEAYRNQYKEVKKICKDRNRLNTFLCSISKDLSSDIYGSVLTFNEALSLIKQ